MHGLYQSVTVRRGGVAVLSGVLLFASFPPLEWNCFAWIALVPLLLVAAFASPAESFKWGFVGGLVFWWMSIVWITRVSWLGWLLLCGYCALYIGLFFMTVSWWIHQRGIHSRVGNFTMTLLMPAIWVGFEYLRSTLFTGFPWNPLGVSQAGRLSLIQCAEWGGVYAVSYIIVLVNVAVGLSLIKSLRATSTARASWHIEWLVALLILGLSVGHGHQTVRSFDGSSRTIQVAIIQLNIQQFEKWAEEWGAAIEARLQRTTAAAIRRFHPDLIVWPETAVPSFVRGSSSTQKLISDLLTNGIPLLVGTMDYEGIVEPIKYYNSSLLFDPKGTKIQSYAKRHLVMFGEYIPLGGMVPFIRCLTPIEESFTPGTTNTVFRLGNASRAFSVLICFEDTVPALARASVRNGARLLINQTNDAWFDPSSASRQHMFHCVFRCVENRVPAVRSTNTGISCFIDRKGRVYGMLAPARGPSPEPECMAAAVVLPGLEMPLTFYTKYGDLFAWACLAFALPLLAAAVLSIWKNRRRYSGSVENQC